MKKRILALLLCLGMLSSVSALAVTSDTTGLSPQAATAYLKVLNQHVLYCSGYATEKAVEGSYPWNLGSYGGFLMDFDQNGTPELYLTGCSYDDGPHTQVWTWTGSQVKKLTEFVCIDGLGSWSKETTLHTVNGHSYFHTVTSGSHMWLTATTGTIYTVEGTVWKELLTYNYNYYDDPYGTPDSFSIHMNGKETSYPSEAALTAALAKYQEKNPSFLSNDYYVGFNNARSLQNLLSQVAANQPSSWAQAEVSKAKAAGLVPSLTGAPGYQSTITREQFAELVMNAVTEIAGEAPAITAAPFADCSNPAVLRAASAGIINGVGDNKFDPKAATNREQIATMIARAIDYLAETTGTDLGSQSASLSKYTDRTSVSSWAADGVATLVANGIMSGTSATTLSPKNPCTVEQSVLLLYRLFTNY